MKLNDRTVTGTFPALPPGKNDKIFFDQDVRGLGLRVRADGGRTWIFQYWFGGRARKVTLGRWPKLSANAAREMVKGVGGLASKVGMGRDPAAEKDEARAVKLTFGEAAELYLAFKADSLRPRSLVEVRHHLNGHAKPLHGIPLKNLTRENVADLLRGITKASGPFASNRTRASIVALLTWATKEGKVDFNVAAATNKQEERSRDRVLSDDELSRIWAALPESNYGDIIKVLILTGQRREEISALRWSEIDLKKKVIGLPKERTKNGRAHTVPISEPVIAIIKKIPKTTGDFVFGTGAGFSGYGKSKKRLDGLLPDMSPWIVHDLRRTVVTGMGSIGVLPHVVEAVVNHVSGHKGGVAGVYNHATYEPEKRAALDKWAVHVLKLLAKRKRSIKEVA